jgi:3',5'-cyclic AMP phosphodiesterase CpdA
MMLLAVSISAKTLVVYYSYTNNCHEIVTTLSDQIQVDVMRIEPAEKGLQYEANNYAIGTALLNAIKAAPNDAASYPAIDPVSVTDLSQYENIIIVTPLWWSRMAAIMQTYLFNYGAQMAGKNVGLIVSSYSSGIDGVVADFKRLVPDANYMSENLWINNANHSNRTTMIQNWLVNTGQLTALNTSKIAVVSDPHVMAPGLLVNEGKAWTDYLNAQRKLVDYSKPLFDEMIRRIKQEIRPGLVFITGDLTKDGEQLSHQYVTSKLDELRTLGIKTLVIPGNHDRGSNSNAVYYDGGNTTAADVATDDWFATQYANYGYGASSEREETTLTYACEPIAGLVVIGIDSGTDGVVSTTTLNWVCNKAEAAAKAGKQVVALMHHPLIPHFTGVDNYVETAVVAKYEDVRNALADAGIRVVFTGHFHTSDIAKDKNADLSRDIYDVNTGSLISYPCDYREVTLGDDLSELSITTGHISELTSGDDFATTAKNRLKTAVQTQVESKGAAYKLIAPTAAEAFIIHAEGNEPDNENTATVLAQLESAATIGVSYIGAEKAQALKDMANSMLQDKSQYGVEGRENVTNDLTLTINMPTFTTVSLTMNAAGIMTYASSHALDFSSVKGLTAYYASGFAEASSTLTLTPVSKAPAESGLMLVGKAEATYSVPVTSGATDDLSGNLFVGLVSSTNVSTTDGSMTNYILANGDEGIGWYKLSEAGELKANSAYLQLPTSSNAPVRMFYDDATTISALTTDIDRQETDGHWYTLTGFQLKEKPTTSGLYIYGKKKVYLKID